jgi:hypothetical protein
LSPERLKVSNLADDICFSKKELVGWTIFFSIQKIKTKRYVYKVNIRSGLGDHS